MNRQGLRDRQHEPGSHHDGGLAPAFSHESGTRIPVYSLWLPHVGPPLSIGMLLAFARQVQGGALTSVFDLQPMATSRQVLDALSRRSGPAILLCSDYVWSLKSNLETAAQAKRIEPQLSVVHGGPSVPKIPEMSEEFLRNHADAADILVHGEGEQTFGEMLNAWKCADDPRALDRLVLFGVNGTSFLANDGKYIRNPPRDRIADLDQLPSPYLTGEYEHLPTSAWPFVVCLETNRGCPYSCSFCDWGSATMSRIRKFDADRVSAEISWMLHRGIGTINIADANFGIMERDVEIANQIVANRPETSTQTQVIFTPAKNTAKHLTRIIDIFLAGDVGFSASLGIQSVDDETLAAADRRNISTEGFVVLGAELRRRGLPPRSDMLLGLPGQTIDTFKHDLQFMIDHQYLIRMNALILLPNAPMNDPPFRRKWEIETNADGSVIATRSFSRKDHQRMVDLYRATIVFEQQGILRHVLHYLQWDCGFEVMDVVDRLLDSIDGRETRLPLSRFALRYLRRYRVPLVGWSALLDEVQDWLVADLGIDRGPALSCVFQVQRALLPDRGRKLPVEIMLEHDYLEYYRNATLELYRTGNPGRPSRPLAAYAPAGFVVAGDPSGLCEGIDNSSGYDGPGDTIYLPQVDGTYELASPLMRNLTQMGRSPDFQSFSDLVLSDYLHRLESEASGREMSEVPAQPVVPPTRRQGPRR